MFVNNLMKAFLLASCCLALVAAEFQSVDLTEETLQGTLETKVTTADPNANGEDTITIKYTLPQTGWLAVGINPTGGGMVGCEVVIGKPEAGTVLKYAISAKSGGDIVEQPNQTLINPSISQADGSTTLMFTKLLAEDGEHTYEAGVVNTFVAAFGNTNTFGYHSGRGVQAVNVPAATPPTPVTSSPTMAPTVADPTVAPVVDPTAAPVVADSASPSMMTGSVLLTTVVLSSLALL
ncbi:MAG: hypothetical protein SGBAC_006293, partial [Bacillariaceae sp.]